MTAMAVIAASDSPEFDYGGTSSPLRRCIVRGIACERRRLIRFVVSPEGEIVPDVDERLPGRGLWVSADRVTLETACRRNAFARAARRSVRVPEDLVPRLEGLLLRRCRDAIGLALRAGKAAFGYHKVREWLIAGRKGVLIEAADGADADCRKLRTLAGDGPVVDALTGDELGATIGRDRVVHGLVTAGSLADRLVREATRLAGVRSAGDGRPQEHST